MVSATSAGKTASSAPRLDFFHQMKMSNKHCNIITGPCNEYWQWFQAPLGRNGKFWVAVGPITRTAGILAYCMLA